MSEEKKSRKQRDAEAAGEQTTNGYASQANGAGATSDFPSSVQRKIKGRVFDVPFNPSWVPGYTLSHDDALFINVARAGYITSAYGDVLDKLLNRSAEEGGPASESEIFENFVAYANDYSWSARGDGASLDPVAAEMRKIALSELTQQLRSINRTFVGVDKDKKREAIDLYVQKHEARLREQAEANIKNSEALTDVDFLSQIGARPMGASAEA